MKVALNKKHSMDSLFMIVLFAVFVFFLLVLLLFSAKAYQSAVDGTRENNELRTAMAYLTTKVHQHDAAEDVSIGEVDGLKALCLRDRIGEKDYTTYIFMDGTEMKELFTSTERTPIRELGTAFCDMERFDLSMDSQGVLTISLTDSSGHSDNLILHPGYSKGGTP